MSLLDTLLARIAREGPLSVADYMAECLWHPRHGYYATRDPLGAEGDFVTAPEISQMFGELVGLWIAQAWHDQGGGPCRLVDLGPGRGTLLADALRATARVPGFHDAAEVWCVEASAPLRRAQADVLPHARFAARLEEVPDGPLYAVANEFFDALPVRQVIRGAGAWHERQIGAADGRLVWGLGPARQIAALEARAVPDGTLVELRPAAEAIVSEIGRRVAQAGGAALIVDYGGDGVGDTFQAVRGHRKVDPLMAPGTADLTAHVDFGALAAAVAPATAHGPMPQGEFLRRLGIEARAATLAARLSGGALASHRAALRRLTGAAEMGTLFQALAVLPAGQPAPAF